MKNVTELFDSSGGLAATYDYSPFGEITVAIGTAAALNPVRFSSEIYDPVLGLVQYNYRPYDPPRGCFINRDPIEERGGLNLYGAVGNDPVNKTDWLGQKTTIGSEGNWTYSAIWGTPLDNPDAGSLDVRVIYTMDEAERKCCNAVRVDRYVRKLIMAGTLGPFVLDHATPGGYTTANGVAEDDEPKGPGFGNPFTDSPAYREPWSFRFKWVAVCAKGKWNGKTLSTLQKTYREGYRVVFIHYTFERPAIEFTRIFTETNKLSHKAQRTPRGRFLRGLRAFV